MFGADGALTITVNLAWIIAALALLSCIAAVFFAGKAAWWTITRRPVVMWEKRTFPNWNWPVVILGSIAFMLVMVLVFVFGAAAS